MSKTVIIGGVAGGATTAARLRRRVEEMEIVLLEKGEYISYANCGLPYYIGDAIKSREALLLQTPEAMRDKFRIDVRIRNEVLKINREEKTVLVRNHVTGEEYKEAYDTLVIATGSSPLKPPIPGIDGKHIHTLWTVPDTDLIKKILLEEKPERAAVIGGGFIGLEMAENLHRAGLKVTVIEMQNQVMAPLDYEMAQLLHENMTANHVELLLGDGVQSFEEHENGTRIRLASGKTIETDMVILSIGVKPCSFLAKEAGLTLNTRGGIVVDDYLHTSDEAIYAVGDVIEVQNPVTASGTMIPLAGPANKQARICADNIAGDGSRYKGTLGTSIAQVFDLAAAVTGINEKVLQSMGKVKGMDYETAVVNQKSHAGYYPGAVPITLKLIFDKTGRIYGAQVIGQDGVDKRIDTIAAVMKLGGKVDDLAELELAYAPPFSSAKDPVNMLGFTAKNILEGMVSFISPKELDTLHTAAGGREDMVILDVTEEVERMVYAVPGSRHIALGQLRSRLSELDPEKLIVPYCAVGVRSYNAARILMQNGFERVRVLEGGTAFYKSMHYLERRSAILTEKVLAEDKVRGTGMELVSDVKHGTDMELVSDVKHVPDAKCGTDMEMVRNRESAQNMETKQNIREMQIIDCCGLQCPGPIMKVYEALQSMEEGQMLQVSATDMGFASDVEAWCRRTGNTFIRTERKEKQNIVYLRKGADASEPYDRQLQAASCPVSDSMPVLPQGKTIIVFSGDLDKVLASFIIANGAAAMGRPVTMFFTFWGLNVLRKGRKCKVKKPFIDGMFGAMMPRGAGKLKLSRMNMAGMGTQMMKKVMKDKNVDSLEGLMKSAMENGVKLVACTMSMDVMGITREELIDGVELAGVASYLGDAEESNVNLFI